MQVFLYRYINVYYSFLLYSFSSSFSDFLSVNNWISFIACVMLYSLILYIVYTCRIGFINQIYIHCLFFHSFNLLFLLYLYVLYIILYNFSKKKELLQAPWFIFVCYIIAMLLLIVIVTPSWDICCLM